MLLREAKKSSSQKKKFTFKWNICILGAFTIAVWEEWAGTWPILSTEINFLSKKFFVLSPAHKAMHAFISHNWSLYTNCLKLLLFNLKLQRHFKAASLSHRIYLRYTETIFKVLKTLPEITNKLNHQEHRTL